MNKKKNISQQKAGFKTPANYFENFKVKTPSNEAQVFENSFESKKINAGFKTPQHYFEQFEIKLPQENNKGKLIALFSTKTISKISAIAAIFLIGFFIFKNQFSFNPLSNQENIDPIALQEQLEKDYFNLEYRDLYISLNGSKTLHNQDLKDINKEDILNYLSENAELITLIEE